MAFVLFITIYIVLAVLPLFLSWFVGGPPRSFHQELASGLGILAFSMILVEFVLSGRFKAVSNGVGMDVTMRFHQAMARTALVFALLHPFFYQGTPAGGARPWDMTRQLTITTDLGDLWSGIAAFLLLPTFILLGIGRKRLDYGYETWRLMHGLGALLIALLVLHHTLNAGRYAAQPAMIGLWLVMAALAAGSLVQVYLVRPLLKRRRPWRVTSLTRLTPRQWEVRLEPQAHAGLHYQAGQFVWLNLGHGPFSMNEHPFSICSAPAAGPQLGFMIKELGDFTRTIGTISPGTLAYVDGPYGNLSIAGRSEAGVGLIAGGVGLAPLLAIRRQMRLTGDPRSVKLIYGNRGIEQIAFAEELGQRGVTLVLTEPPPGWQGETGLIDGPLIDRVFTPAETRTWLFVLCGPTPMMDRIEAHLIRRGTPSNRILSERFDYD